MATVVVCDHDSEPATLRVTVESFTGSTVTAFDCCSAACAVECLTTRLAEAEQPAQPGV